MITFDRLPLPVCAGVLTVAEPKQTRRYAVREIPAADGRGFRLVKPKATETYYVLLGAGVPDICDCVGHLRYGYCVHVTALRELAESGSL